MQVETIIASVLSAAAIIAVAVITYRSNLRVKETEAETAPYDALGKRVAALETQVTLLLSDQWSDRTFMRQMLQSWPAGVPLPQPLPLWLAAHYGLPPVHPPTPGSIIERPIN